MFTTRKRLFAAAMALIFGSQFSVARAHESMEVSEHTPPPSTVDLDLSSTARLPAQGVVQTPVDIQVGDHTHTITANSLVTAAELVAAANAAQLGAQGLVLASDGRATGGSAVLTAALSQAISNLVVPQGVTAVRDFGAHGALNLAGNLTNAGALFALSSSSSVTTATINAANIFNQAGAVISSVSPALGLPGAASYIADLSLSLNAVNDIINAGRIESAGNLLASAGGSVVNALPAGASGPSPVMQAMQNVNIAAGAGQITNSGLIAAIAGNVNLDSQMTQGMTVSNLSGVMQALNGSVNVTNSALLPSQTLLLSGGDLIARELNVMSAAAVANINVREITGTVNIKAGEAHVQVAQGNLAVGNLDLSGDPTFYNTGGSVSLGLFQVAAPLAVVANTDINVLAGARIITSGNPVVLVAGADFTTAPPAAAGQVDNDSATVLTINGGSAAGGNVNLQTLQAFDTSNLAGSGGNVTIIAFRASTQGLLNGNVNLPSAAVLRTGGSGASSNGNVEIIAEGREGIAVNAPGGINTSGGTGSGGRIEIRSAQAMVNGGVTIQNGSITNGNFEPGDLKQGSIVTGPLTSGTGNSHTFVETMGAITTGAITGNSNFVGFEAGGQVRVNGDVNLTATGASEKNGGNFEVHTTAGGILVAGALRADGSSTLGGGGGSFELEADQGNVQVTGEISAVGKMTPGSTQGGSGGGLEVRAMAGNFIYGSNILMEGVGSRFNQSEGGGNIEIEVNSASVLNLGGILNIRGSLTGPGGQNSSGTLEAVNLGTGGMNVPNPGNIITGANPNTGSGGEVKLGLFNPRFFNPDCECFEQGEITGMPGPLTIGAGTINLSGGTQVNSCCATGGDIGLGGSSLTIVGGALNLISNASASNGGQSGSLRIILTGANSSVSFGNGSGQVNFTAIAGGPGQAGTVGRGGVLVSVGGNLAIGAGAFNIGFNSAAGARGQDITFIAGTSGSGNLLFTGNVDASGVGSNARSGDITLVSNSASPFVVGGATVNGVTGNVIANGGLGGGFNSGGRIEIRNNGTGGVFVNTASISARAGVGGNGGEVELVAPAGPVSVTQGVIDLTRLPGGGCCGSSGGFLVDAKTFSVVAPGGGAPTATLDLNLGHATSGPGRVNIFTAMGNLVVGTQPGQLRIFMQGPNGGGEVEMSVGGNLTFNVNAFTSGPSGGDGFGPNILLEAGANGAGNLLINGSLSANGVNRQGNSIILISDSATPFMIGGAVTNGVTGTLSALGFNSGSISVTNHGAGGIILRNLANAQADSTFRLEALNGPLEISKGTIGNHRFISLVGAPLIVTEPGSATPATSELTINLSNECCDRTAMVTSALGNLNVGTGPGRIIVNGPGGGEDQAIFSAGGNLTVDPVGLSNIARLSMEAGTAGQGNALFNGTFNGEKFTIISNSVTPLTLGVPVTTNGVTGNVNVTSPGQLGGTAELHVVNHGTGGTFINALPPFETKSYEQIEFAATNGPLNIMQGNLDVSTTHVDGCCNSCCDGGRIDLVGNSINVFAPGGGPATQPLNLIANGSNGGLGGEIHVTQLLGALVIGNAPGQITITALSGPNTDTFSASGAAFVSAGGNLTVNMNSVQVGAHPNAPNISGPTIDFRAGEAGAGNLLVNGSIMATGKGGNNNGGKVILMSHSATPFTVSPSAPGITNGVRGNISANGTLSGVALHGSFIMIANTGPINIVADAMITANGQSFNDDADQNGRIVFTTPNPGTGPLQVNVDGLVQATNDASSFTSGNRGIIAFHGGPGQNVTLTSAVGGVVHAGQAVRMGNVDLNMDDPFNSSLALLNVFAGIVTIGGVNTFIVGNAIQSNAAPPAPPQAPIVQLPLRENLFTESPPVIVITEVNDATRQQTFLLDTQIGTRIAVDVTNVVNTAVFIPSPTMPGQQIAGPAVGGSVEASATSADTFDYSSGRGSGVTIGPGTKGSYFNLDVGNVVFAPTNGPITVGTHEGNVQIQKGSIAFVMETGHDVAVYSLHDSTRNGVSVVVNKKSLTVPPGKQLVLTRQDKPDFDKVNPGADIAYRNPKFIDFGEGIKGFISDFSIYSCLTAVKPLKNMLTSNDPKMRSAANKILKNAVILADLTGSMGNYKVGKESN